MYTIFLNYWRRASFIFLLSLLLYCYIQLPESIAYQHNEVGRPIGFVDKQIFFYISVGLIVGLNLLFGLFRAQFDKIDFSKFSFDNQWFKEQEKLKIQFSGWVYAILSIINSYLVFALFGLQSINRDVSKNLDRDYNWFLVLGVVLFIILFFYLPIKLLFTKPSDSLS